MRARGRGINFYTSDNVVLDWWESIPSRDRSKRLCELIRQSVARPESVTDRISAVNTELNEIRNVIICRMPGTLPLDECDCTGQDCERPRWHVTPSEGAEVSDRDDQLDNAREDED